MGGGGGAEYNIRSFRLDDWTSTSLSTSTSFEFQTSDISRAIALHVGFR